MEAKLSSVEICAGAGGQALGLEMAGYHHAALIEIDDKACETLRLNRPSWNVVEGDVRAFDGRAFQGLDLLAGGVPCPPFSKAGLQRGVDDERDLFPQALRLVEEIRPRAVLLENVRGLLDKPFDTYRNEITLQLQSMGYAVGWKLVVASDFGVPQLRPRVVLVALRAPWASTFSWPRIERTGARTVGEALKDLMGERGWKGAQAWAKRANSIAPTIVGGSTKHGGPDLGPTRSKRAWSELGVNGKLIAETAPDPDFEGAPYLTVRMVARLQGFPDQWSFAGSKTRAYRQVGNAFPPPVAAAIGNSISQALMGKGIVERQILSREPVPTLFEQ